MFGHYRSIEVLGQGASAVVLRALHPTTQAIVAIKLAKDVTASQRLVEEQAHLEQLGRANHPGIVKLLGAGSVDARRWLALECLDANSLRERMRPGYARYLDGLEQRVVVAQQIADALASVHARGIVHGDLTPQNILFRGELPVIIDWATARLCANAKELRNEPDSAYGTPGYIAPERLRGEAFDTRSDLYSLGCILHELWTARAPFVSDDTSALCQSHLIVEPLPPSHWVPELPRELDEIVRQLLAKDPRRRLPYARFVAERLAAWLGTRAATTRLTEPLPIVRPRAIERDELDNELAEHLQRSAGGKLGISLIQAAPGAGHTRMLEDLAVLAHQAGFRALWVIRGPAQASEPLTSLRPLLELIEDSTHSGDDHLELQALTPYSERLRQSLAIPENLPSVPFERTRERLNQALWTCLAYVARTKPLALFVDTLETIDELSAIFLESLDARVGAPLACHVFVACSESQSLRAWDNAARFELEPLSDRGTLELLNELFAGALPPSASTRDALGTSTRCPARVVELAATLMRSQALRFSTSTGELTIDSAQYQIGRLQAAQLPLALDDRGAKIAGLIAAAGMSSELELVSAALAHLELERQTIELTVAELRAAGVLIVSAQSYRFAHESYRQGCLEQLNASELRRSHEALARAIRERPHGRRSYRQLGLHWLGAGEPARAIVTLSLAARRSMRRLALKESIDSLTLALTLLTADSRASEPWSARAVRLAVRLLELLSTAARHDEVLTLGASLLDHTPATLRSPRVRAAQLIAQSQRICGNYAEAETALVVAEAAGQLSACAAALRDNRAWIETQLLGVFLNYSRRDLAAMNDRLVAMAEPIRRWGSCEQQASFNMWRANALVLGNRYTFDAVAIRLERRALRLLRRARSSSHEAGMCQFDLAFMLLLGDRHSCEEGLGLLLDAEERAKRLGDAVLMSRILTYQAVALRRTHKVEACAQRASRALAAASRCKLRGYMGAVKGCMAWVALKRDDLVATRLLCAEADALFVPAAGDVNWEYPFRWLSLLPQLAAEAAADRMEEARPLVDKLCGASQARLASPLGEYLSELSTGWDDYDDATVARRLAAVVRCAAQLSYL